MDLPIDTKLRIGFHNTYPHAAPGDTSVPPDLASAKRVVAALDAGGFDAMWAGDHVAFAAPIMDPLIQLAQAAALSERMLVGVGVLLLPLRHPAPVAKQAATLDRLSGGRFIFGVGVGGEFPAEFAACGVPVEERGARLTEGITVMRKLWSGEAVRHDGRFFSFPEVRMQPPPLTPGGPPIWCGGRSDAALRRAGRMADGWISYAVTADMFRAGLAKIAAAAEGRKRALSSFGTGHLLFVRLDRDADTALAVATKMLSARYGMDFTKPAKRYCARGTGEQVAEAIRAFYDAGCRHVVTDLLVTKDERLEHIERFAGEVMPHLGDLRAA